MTEYKWHHRWVSIPDHETGRKSGRTHGVCVTKDENVIVFHQAYDGLLTFDPDGALISATGGDRWLGAHGLTKFEENGEEMLWLVNQWSGEVAKTRLNGEVVQTFAQADHEAYAGDNAKKYIPTWAASNPENGEVWVADGYGASLVHRYAADGSYLSSISGAEDGAPGTFNCPHGINFEYGANGLELYITDRANSRIQVFDPDGKFIRYASSCHSPCCFDFLGDQVVIPELFTGVKVLNKNTLEVEQEFGLGKGIGVSETEHWWPPKAPEGWPNLAGTDADIPNHLIAPHGACFAPNGDIYVVEWVIGGRITKLEKLA